MAAPYLPEPPITRKSKMYTMLQAGLLGNTAPSWSSAEAWLASPDSRRYEMWGVRTLVPGGPCRLNCPREEVAETANRPEFKAAGVNISVMIGHACRVTLWADVMDTPDKGLIVYGIEYPPKGGSWRALMPSQGRQYEGLAARMLLRKHLNEASLADVEALLERWPGHAVELSATDRPFGIIPGRNIVIWEVRQY